MAKTIVRDGMTLTKQILQNRCSLSLNFVRGETQGKQSLKIAGRPPGLFYKKTEKSQGHRQGDHTIAWSLTQKSFEWLLKDVTPVEAAIKLSHDFHRDLLITCKICFESIGGDGGVHIHQLLTDADDAHLSMISTALASAMDTEDPVTDDMVLNRITRYIENVLYILQFLPFSAVNSNSGGRGEKAALDHLIRVEKGKLTGVKCIVDNLGVLFDERAINFQYNEEKSDAVRVKPVAKYLGPMNLELNIVAYQIMGLFRFCYAFTHIFHELLRPKTALEPIYGTSFSFLIVDYNNEQVIRNIQDVIFQSRGISANFASSKRVITDALHYINVMRRKYDHIWQNSGGINKHRNFVGLKHFV